MFLDPKRMQSDTVSIASSGGISNNDNYYWGPDDINPWSQDRMPNVNSDLHREMGSDGRSVSGDFTPGPLQRVTTVKLFLPSEENKFAGFCKGAWKLQIGMKKAMTAEVSRA